MGIFNAFRHPQFDALLRQARSTPDALLIDVRMPSEYRNDGHVPQSVNLPLDLIEETPIEAGKTLFVYCRSGVRSGRACALLRQRGYKAVNVGGILDYRGPLEYG